MKFDRVVPLLRIIQRRKNRSPKHNRPFLRTSVRVFYRTSRLIEPRGWRLEDVQREWLITDRFGYLSLEIEWSAADDFRRNVVVAVGIMLHGTELLNTSRARRRPIWGCDTGRKQSQHEDNKEEIRYLGHMEVAKNGLLAE